MILGAHVSIAGGIHRAVPRAVRMGGETLQVFSKSPVRWDAPDPSEDAVSRFRAGIRRYGLGPLAVHASYLINPASPAGDVRRRSREALLDELRRAHRLGAAFLILHPGSHGGEGESAGVQRATRVLEECLIRFEGEITLLVENTAGQGGSIGYRFEHLRDMLEVLEGRFDVGMCLDTCHAHAAGYGGGEADACRMLDELDAVVGREALRALHVNDSKTERGSRVDRHERIGRGALGELFFRVLVCHERVSGLPAYLEVPGGPAAFQEDLALLKRWRGRRTGAPGENSPLRGERPVLLDSSSSLD